MFLGVSYPPPRPPPLLLVFLVGGGAVGQVADLAKASSCCSIAIVLPWVLMVLNTVPSVPISDGMSFWMSSILLDKVICSPSKNSLALAWAASALSTAFWTITDTSSALFALPSGVSLCRWMSFRFLEVRGSSPDGGTQSP